jgi:hypothetical protein
MSVEVRTISAIPISTAGIAALSAACLVLAAAPPPARVSTYSAPAPAPPAVWLAVQPLPLPLDLINQQVVFNVGLTINWLATGAALAQRITQVPGTVLAAVQAGTSLPTALAQGLSAFADIEFEAGRDLIGYAQDIANFQLQFRATTLSAVPPFNAGPGQQFVVATTMWGLTVVQQLANIALAVVTSLQQFTHGALQTPLPTTISAVTIGAVTPATKPTAFTPKVSALQPHSTTVSFREPLAQRHPAATELVQPPTHRDTHQDKRAHRH